jgi:hypothetical protein
MRSNVKCFFAGDFVYITDNAYTQSEIRLMEIEILRALNFDLVIWIAPDLDFRV